MTIAWIALVLSLLSLAWQVYVWWHGRRFDVAIRIEQGGFGGVVVGSGKYEMTVVVQNMGGTVEAVQDVWLMFDDRIGETIGPPSVIIRDLAGGELRPRRNVRVTFDLLGSRFAPIPSTLAAYARLESGEVVGPSERWEVSAKEIGMAGVPLGARQLEAERLADDESGAAEGPDHPPDP